MFLFIVNCLIIVLLPFFFEGFISLVEKGPGKSALRVVASPVKEFLQLLARGVKSGSDRNYLQEIASSVILSSVVMAGTLTPILIHRPIFDFNGSFFLFLSFLVMERITRVIGRKKTDRKEKGDPVPEWRELLPEITAFIVLALCSVTAGQSSFGRIFFFGGETAALAVLIKLSVVLTLWVLLVRGEGDRTNGYEGSDRAVVLYGGWLKSLLFATLIAGAIIPYWNLWRLEWGAYVYLPVYLAVIALVGWGTGLARRALARREITGYADTALIACSVLVFCLSFLAVLF